MADEEYQDEDEEVLVTDQIERTITVPVSTERVWTALTTEEGMRAWFGDIAVMDVRPEGEALFGWSEEGMSFHAVIEAVEPYTRFAFRWAANADTPVAEGPSTLVEFLIDGDENGTRITVIESGFASFPENVRELEDAGLVLGEKRGREVQPVVLEQTADWLQERARQWQRSLQRLAAHLEEDG